MNDFDFHAEEIDLHSVGPLGLSNAKTLLKDADVC